MTDNTQSQASPDSTQIARTTDGLFAWVADVTGGVITRKSKAAGGNRRQSWAVDVQDAHGTTHEYFLRHDPRETIDGVEPHTIEREAEIFRTIAPIAIKAPKYVAESADLRAVLTDRAHGIAEFRHLKDPAAKQAIARQFMQNIATLHRHDARAVTIDGGAKGRIKKFIAKDVAIWKAMYEEVGQPDPLIDLGFAWLEENMPDPDGQPVIVHGDAGPGNFMFHDNQLTALIDWEFCHIGDPMDDIAWFAMRCVMEPVPDFQKALRDYEEAVGAPIDRTRLLYHRVLVSTRVCVIRHRNFASEPAYAIVSRGLNRRLLVQALGAANTIAIPAPQAVEAPQTDRETLYDKVIHDLGDIILPRSTDKQASGAAKNAAKVVKYLKALDRYGDAIDVALMNALTEVLGTRPANVESGMAQLGAALRDGEMSLDRALAFFAKTTLWDAQLSAEASGSIAHRHYDPI